jgi:hypothetical protein
MGEKRERERERERERDMGVLRKKKEIGRCERREERECKYFFRIIIIYGNATMLPNALDSTIAILIYKDWVVL